MYIDYSAETMIWAKIAPENGYILLMGLWIVAIMLDSCLKHYRALVLYLSKRSTLYFKLILRFVNT